MCQAGTLNPTYRPPQLLRSAAEVGHLYPLFPHPTAATGVTSFSKNSTPYLKMPPPQLPTSRPPAQCFVPTTYLCHGWLRYEPCLLQCRTHVAATPNVLCQLSTRQCAQHLVGCQLSKQRLHGPISLAKQTQQAAGWTQAECCVEVHVTRVLCPAAVWFRNGGSVTQKQEVRCSTRACTAVTIPTRIVV